MIFQKYMGSLDSIWHQLFGTNPRKGEHYWWGHSFQPIHTPECCRRQTHDGMEKIMNAPARERIHSLGTHTFS
ncbi:MAG: hypothetical protein ACRCUY_05490 [Thermoguttaceae bacterium]